MKVYVVGGWVRDQLLGRNPSDKDYVVVGAKPDEMICLGFKPVGKDFPVFLDNKGNEYALARTERKTGNKHTDFEFTFTPDTTLEEDLWRRDFKMNAIAYDEETKEYIDPCGGIDNIKQRVIHHITSEHFVEDPLRVLRAFRQSAQLDFEVCPATVTLCTNMVRDGMLEYLTPERVWHEIEKALETGSASEKFFYGMRECGALSIILPEIDRLFETPEKIEYHPSGNSGVHTMVALSRVRHYSPMVKFAVLLHDVAKGTTPVEILPAHHDHDIRGLPLIDEICDRLKIPNDYRKFAKSFCNVHMRIAKLNSMTLKKQYDLVASISNNFKDRNYMCSHMYAFYADLFGEYDSPYSDINLYNDVCNKCFEIYNIMEGIGVSELPQEYQDSLAKQSGEKFGTLLREYKIRYLRDKLKK